MSTEDTPHSFSDVLGDAPTFDDEFVRRCKESRDYRPIIFEWFKYVATLAFAMASIQRTSPALVAIPPTHFFVLSGLLQRCAKLMLAVMELSHGQRFGEASAIIDRCIAESAMKIVWLCTSPADEKFSRYIADGLKTELELKAIIGSNVAARGGDVIQIEERMLASIARHLSAAGLTEDEIRTAKKLPTLDSIMTVAGFDRLGYLATQKLGSHHVHGTWPSLLMHYLEVVEGSDPPEFIPRDHDVSAHFNQYMMSSLTVLAALKAHCAHSFQSADASVFEALFDEVQTEILKVNFQAVGQDYDIVDQRN